MKGFFIGLIFGGFIVFLLLLVIGLSMNNQTLTGNVVKTNSEQTPIKLSEETIVDTQQIIKADMHYIQIFELYKPVKVFINVTSDKSVGYALLPEFEFEHYTKGESYRAYDDLESIGFIQKTYYLGTGKYTLVITSLEEPTNVHLIVRASEDN